jgi:hypothetical protein
VISAGTILMHQSFAEVLVLMGKIFVQSSFHCVPFCLLPTYNQLLLACCVEEQVTIHDIMNADKVK